MKRFFIAWLSLVSLVSIGVGGSFTAFADDKVVVLLDWFVNPDHGPLYVAFEKGFFKIEDSPRHNLIQKCRYYSAMGHLRPSNMIFIQNHLGIYPFIRAVKIHIEPDRISCATSKTVQSFGFC